MVISHKYKFIFIKTSKTAGTSIEVFLSQQCGPDDVFTPIWPHVEPHQARNYEGVWNPLAEIANSARSYRKGAIRCLRDLVKMRKYYNHIPASVARFRVSKDVWQSYFKFCVERNPWDKTLSHFHMVRQGAATPVSFDEYIDRGVLCINYPKYCDADDNVLVDRVLRYEALIDELAEVFRELSVPFDGSLGVNAKSEFRRNKTPYQDAYTAQQREAIGRAFATEIAMHGYQF